MKGVDWQTYSVACRKFSKFTIRTVIRFCVADPWITSTCGSVLHATPRSSVGLTSPSRDRTPPNGLCRFWTSMQS